MKIFELPVSLVEQLYIPCSLYLVKGYREIQVRPEEFFPSTPYSKHQILPSKPVKFLIVPNLLLQVLWLLRNDIIDSNGFLDLK